MQTRRLSILAAAAVITVISSAAVKSEPLVQEFKKRVIQTASKFVDLTMNIKVTYQNQDELSNIGKDFGTSYKFENSTLYLKVPDKFRMTSKVGPASVTYIINGDKKYIRAAGIINKSDDISSEPHKRQGPLDAGILDESLWKFYVLEKVKMENGHYVVTMHWSNSPDKKQYLWVDSSDMRLVRRERREADGSLIARYAYSGHTKHLQGMQIPGEVSVFNRRGKLGGKSVYLNKKVNTGLADNLFK